jgi:hypothetical protein
MSGGEMEVHAAPRAAAANSALTVLNMAVIRIVPVTVNTNTFNFKKKQSDYSNYE